nr:unnamed protein product [Digitaria exilis]
MSRPLAHPSDPLCRPVVHPARHLDASSGCAIMASCAPPLPPEPVARPTPAPAASPEHPPSRTPQSLTANPQLHPARARQAINAALAAAHPPAPVPEQPSRFQHAPRLLQLVSTSSAQPYDTAISFSVLPRSFFHLRPRRAKAQALAVTPQIHCLSLHGSPIHHTQGSLNHLASPRTNPSENRAPLAWNRRIPSPLRHFHRRAPPHHRLLAPTLQPPNRGPDELPRPSLKLSGRLSHHEHHSTSPAMTPSGGAPLLNVASFHRVTPSHNSTSERREFPGLSHRTLAGIRPPVRPRAFSTYNLVPPNEEEAPEGGANVIVIDPEIDAGVAQEGKPPSIT